MRLESEYVVTVVMSRAVRYTVLAKVMRMQICCDDAMQSEHSHIHNSDPIHDLPVPI